jgi:hypothetical protein
MKLANLSRSKIGAKKKQKSKKDFQHLHVFFKSQVFARKKKILRIKLSHVISQNS